MTSSGGKPPRACPRCGGDHTGSVCPQVAALPTVPISTSGGAGSVSLPKAAGPDVETVHDLQADDPVGEYRVVGILGRGGFGVVYEAIQPVIGKRVAIKVLNLRYSTDPVFVERFTAEARAVNQIRHRHIIDIFSFGQLADGRQYYVMELLRGQTLSKYMDTRGRLSGAEALPILDGIARALDAAHGEQIAHRDLKPDNVFITNLDEDGKPFPKLLDFGIAKLLARSQVEKAQPTITGGLVGTPPYMSPEQCKGEKVDHRTDVYSLGVIAYDMITGKLPFEGKSDVEVMWKHITEPPPPPSEVAGVAPALDGPILAMLEKDPDKRPASAGAAIRRLADALDAPGESTRATPGPLPAVASPRSAVTPALRTTPAVTAEPRTTPAATVSRNTPAATAPTLAGETSLARPTPAGKPISARVAVPPPPGRRWVGPTIIAVLAAGSVAAGVMMRGRPDSEGANLGKPRAAIMVPDAAPPAVTPPDAAVVAVAPPDAGVAMVRFEITGAPDGTEVRVGATVVGEAPGTITLPAGKDAVELTFSKAGYVTAKRKVVPLADDVLSVTLRKTHKTTKPPSEIPPW